MTPTEKAIADYMAGQSKNPYPENTGEWYEYFNKIEDLFNAEFLAQQNRCPTCEE